jgi:hypothetical protein
MADATGLRLPPPCLGHIGLSRVQSAGEHVSIATAAREIALALVQMRTAPHPGQQPSVNSA